MSELTFSSTSANETQALGERLGALLEPGDVLVLTGDLGAGKTQLTKGIARSMALPMRSRAPRLRSRRCTRAPRCRSTTLTSTVSRAPTSWGMPDCGTRSAATVRCVIEWGEQFVDEIGDERLDVYVTRLETQAVAGEEPPREVRLVAHDARGEQILSGLAT